MKRCGSSMVLALAVVVRCVADMPAVDVYKVRWEPLKAAAARVEGSGAFIEEVEMAAGRDAGGDGSGVLVFRSAQEFVGPLNGLLRTAVAAGRKKQTDEFLRSSNEGGWITGELIAREGGRYTVWIACVGDPAEDFVVEYNHRFADGRKAVHSHHIGASSAMADGTLAWVTGAEEITIEDHWVGYGPASPAMADYNLHREGGDFVGRAAFSVGGHFKKTRKDSCGVRVPADAAARFLRSLAGCPFRDGEYKPGIHHTDDYPDIRITVKADGKNVVFETKSQGEFHAPWALEWGGKVRVVEGDAPGRALKGLRPYLARERFEALVKAVTAEPKGGDNK